MSKPSRSVGDEFRKSMKDTKRHEAAEVRRRQQETLERISDWFAGIASSVESDVRKLPRRQNAQAEYEEDIYLEAANRKEVERSPGFRALQSKCREMDIDFSWRSRSYTDIDMTDSKYTHNDLHVMIRPGVPYQERTSYYEAYDPPTGFGRLGP